MTYWKVHLPRIWLNAHVFNWKARFYILFVFIHIWQMINSNNRNTVNNLFWLCHFCNVRDNLLCTMQILVLIDNCVASAIDDSFTSTIWVFIYYNSAALSGRENDGFIWDEKKCMKRISIEYQSFFIIISY